MNTGKILFRGGIAIDEMVDAGRAATVVRRIATA